MSAVLEVQGLRKRLGGRPILAGVDLRCGAGAVAVVLGENGSGKSTLLRLCAGILEPDAGQVVLCGAPLHGGGVAARRRLSYVPDATEPLPELTVQELATLVAALKRTPPPEPALCARLGVAALLHQRLSTLSFGQRKRACLLAALAGAPELLILDEPTNGLDPDGARLIEELVQERAAAGRATLLSSNDAPFAAALARRGAALWRIREGLLTPSAP